MIDSIYLQDKAQSIAEILKALAHETRLLAVCHIGEREWSVLELADALQVGQSCLSQHLAKLRNLGILAVRRDANQCYYRIADPGVMEIISTLKAVYCKIP
jgi:ArsR family transcriptional regulator, virulence genes transcriptional regulator